MDDAIVIGVDRTAFAKGRLSDPSEEKAYRLSRDPDDRLAAVELMRQIVYGHDPATARLQRLLEVARRAPR